MPFSSMPISLLSNSCTVEAFNFNSTSVESCFKYLLFVLQLLYICGLLIISNILKTSSFVLVLPNFLELGSVYLLKSLFRVSLPACSRRNQWSWCDFWSMYETFVHSWWHVLSWILFNKLPCGMVSENSEFFNIDFISTADDYYNCV